MADAEAFRLSRRPDRWLGGEPRVFSVNTEDDFPKTYDVTGARLLIATYQGGGVSGFFDQVAEVAQLPSRGSFQAWLENLGDLSDIQPLIVYLRHADRLLADIGPALIHIVTGWERFARHGNGVHSMYLVLERA